MPKVPCHGAQFIGKIPCPRLYRSKKAEGACWTLEQFPSHHQHPQKHCVPFVVHDLNISENFFVSVPGTRPSQLDDHHLEKQYVHKFKLPLELFEGPISEASMPSGEVLTARTDVCFVRQSGS